MDILKWEIIVSIVIDGTLLIYFNHSKKKSLDGMQRKLVDDLRKSPYRNYINREVPSEERGVYFMLFYPDYRVEEIYGLLEKEFEKLMKPGQPPFDDCHRFYLILLKSFLTRPSLPKQIQ